MEPKIQQKIDSALDRALNKIQEHQAGSKKINESEKQTIKILKELIKEQVQNAHTHNTTR